MANYRSRVVDAELRQGMSAMGGVLVDGPKATGKASTAEQIARNDIDLSPRDLPRDSSHRHEFEKTNRIVEINKQVHIAVRLVIRTSDTAERRKAAASQLLGSCLKLSRIRDISR